MKYLNKLIKLAQDFENKSKQHNYDGEKFELPSNHKPLMVLQGDQTFSCAACQFVDVEKHECNNKHYIDWKGDKKLPKAPLDKICSDWFEPQ